MFYFVFSLFLLILQTTYRLQERLKKLANHAANIEFFFCFIRFHNNLNHHIQQLVCVSVCVLCVLCCEPHPCLFLFCFQYLMGLHFTCYNSPSVSSRLPAGSRFVFQNVQQSFSSVAQIAIPLNAHDVNSWFICLFHFAIFCLQLICCGFGPVSLRYVFACSSNADTKWNERDQKAPLIQNVFFHIPGCRLAAILSLKAHTRGTRGSCSK